MVGVREFYEKDGQMLVRRAVLPEGAGQGPPCCRAAWTHPQTLCLRATYCPPNLIASQPGKKGISLPEEQWTRLLAGLPGLAAALEAA